MDFLVDFAMSIYNMVLDIIASIKDLVQSIRDFNDEH